MSGTATKGVIAGGIINVYSVNDPTTILFTANDRTGADGSYTLTVPADAEFAGDLLIVEVVAAEDGSSTMVCDADPVGGCNVGGSIVPFGETIPLPAGVSLRAATQAPEDGGSVIVHMNALTELAVALASQGTLDGTSILDATRRIATLLDLGVSDFSTVPGLDVTNAEAVGAAGAAQQKLAALSAAFLAEALEATGTGLEEALAGVTTRLADGIARFADDPAMADTLAPQLVDLLQAALSIADTANLDDVTADLLDDLTVAETGELPVPDPTPSPGEGLAGLEQAKQFVADLRAVNEAFSPTELRADATPLQEALELAQQVATTATESALLSAADVVAAFGEAVEAFRDDTTLTEFTATNGVTVSIVPGGNELSAEFSVADLERTHNGIVSTVSLSAGSSAEGSLDLGNFERAFDGSVNFSGNVENDQVRISIEGGRADVVDLTSETSEPDEFGRTAGTDNIDRLELILETRIEQVASETVTDPVRFRGTLRAIADRVARTSGFSFQTEPQRTEFASLSLALTGLLATSAQEVRARVSVAQDGTDFFFGRLPVGTVFENFESYEVEQGGKIITRRYLDPLRPEGSFLEVSRREFLTDAEVQALGGYPDGNEERYGAAGAIRLDLELDGREFDFSGRQFTNDQRVFLIPLDSCDDSETGELPIDAVECLNNITLTPLTSSGVPFRRFPAYFAIDGVGLLVSEQQFLTGYSRTGGGFDYELVCTGFCAVFPIGEDETTFDFSDPFQPLQPIFLSASGEAFERRGSPIRGAFQISVVTDVVGLGNGETRLSLSGQRLDIDTYQGQLTLAYAGRRFVLDTGIFDTERLNEVESITLTNQDGIVVELTQDEAGGITGTISRGDEGFATIEEDGGVLLIRYTDDTFESI